MEETATLYKRIGSYKEVFEPSRLPSWRVSNSLSRVDGLASINSILIASFLGPAHLIRLPVTDDTVLPTVLR